MKVPLYISDDKMWNQSKIESSLVSLHGDPGQNQTIRVHNVEHGEDIEGIWASGSYETDPFPAVAEMEREKEGDGLVSAVWLSLPRVSCGDVPPLQDLHLFLLSPFLNSLASGFSVSLCLSLTAHL